MSFRNALISVSNKSHLSHLISNLIFPYSPRHTNLFNIYSTGGTYNFIKDNYEKSKHKSNFLFKVSDITQFPEILNGRVKTLHPKIMGGILYDKHDEQHIKDAEEHDIKKIDLVVANLYPFGNAVKQHKLHKEIIENIDIGGATMIRAAAKNYKDTCVLVHPSQYDEYIKRFKKNEITLEYKRHLAATAFQHISSYDNQIANFFNPQVKNYILEKKSDLKYGMNPTNRIAGIYAHIDEHLPFTVLNGKPGYINFLDAINSWRLVNEVKTALDTDVCASFKHTIPAGVAIKNDNNETMCEVYKKTRNVDPLSSFGDFIAISGNVDLECANYISSIVSDGIIADSYDEDALEVLSKKKNGNYVVLQGHSIDFFEDTEEVRTMHGMTLIQETEKGFFGMEDLNNIVTNERETTKQHCEDMIIASISLKYAQSNSVAFAYKGQLIGLGAGQQNRLDCIRLAGNKALLWWLRNNKETNTEFMKQLNNDNIKGQARLTLFYDFLNNHINSDFKRNIQQSMNNVVMSSDGFIPFNDNILEAVKYGVSHIVNPGGSVADEAVITECDKRGLVMFHTGKRLFFH